MVIPVMIMFLDTHDELADALDRLLRSFADQGRMKMIGEYTPCYEVVQRD